MAIKFRIPLFLIATLIGSNAVASVNNFRGVKFGADFKTLEKARVCHWHKRSFKPGWDSRVYNCTNFKIEGIKSPLKVYVEFTKGRFSSASVDIPNSELSKVKKKLKAKYGIAKGGKLKGAEYYSDGDVLIIPSSAKGMHALVFKGTNKSL